MSDSYLFQCKKNKFEILVFGISTKDSRDMVKSIFPVWYRDFGFSLVSKNPSSVSSFVLCATTEKQQEQNREKNRQEEIKYYKDNPESLKKIIEQFEQLGLIYHITMKDLEEN